ncbi:MAG: hypothetical protein ACREMP_05785 [Candidatus Tyrphobacter sp.]
MRQALLCVAAIVAAFASGLGTRGSQAPARALGYACSTTQANGTVRDEYDTIARVGDWQFGAARPVAGQGEPFYDYYVQHVALPYTYIQIDPRHNTYFVGTSTPPPGRRAVFNGSKWSIVFPASVGTYTYTQVPASSRSYTQAFTIAYTDLEQHCTLTSSPVPAPPPHTATAHPLDYADIVGEWRCAPAAGGATQSLTVERLGENWLQGTARSADGRVVYEENLFSTPSQQVLVHIEVGSPRYFIATSLAPSLQGSSWTVVFPKTRVGFTIRALAQPAPRTAASLRGGFETVFADGVQRCVPASQ